MIPIAVFASGRGTNFEAILSAIRQKTLDAKVVCVVCDQPEANVLSIARRHGIPVVEAFDEAVQGKRDEFIVAALSQFKPAFAVLAGYMRVIKAPVLEYFRAPQGYSRIVNIHPSLLPAFPGKDSYRQAWEHGCKMAGVTVHLVDERVDQGAICAQESFSISDCHSPEEVEIKGLAIEHRLFSETLQWVLPQAFEVVAHGRRICVYPR